MDLCLVVDHDCNLRCDYCYTGEKRAEPMSGSVARNAIDFALSRQPAVFSLSFFGGEPLLNRELIHEAMRYVDARIKAEHPEVPWITILSTNGTLLDASTANWLLALPHVEGLRAHVSLDGPAEVHDLHRKTIAGRGSHEYVRSGISRLKASGVPVLPVATINPDTASRAGDIIGELLSVADRQAVFSVNLRAPWDDAALDRLRMGLREGAAVWADCLRKGRAVALEPLASKILYHLHGSAPCPGRCRMSLEEIVVAPSGRLYPCGEMVGTDRQHDLCIGDLRNGFDVTRIAELLARKDRANVVCAECGIRERCDRHCGCRHIALTGQLGAFTNTLCSIEEALVTAADQVAEVLWAEQCDTFLEMFYRTEWQLVPGAALVANQRGSE